ncbi:MAG: Anti-sigma factor antagonist [Cyanobacteria bacterium RYN_339]|nr:Anti-sigma factor antagonist [Cyanobacteria bacterium RYN_339]
MKIEIFESPERLTVALIGDLDSCAAQELDTQLEQIIPLCKGELTVDLGQLSYLNSTGIRSFIRLEKLLAPEGKRFVFTNATARLRRIFQYCGLESYFNFLDEDVACAGTELAVKGA